MSRIFLINVGANSAHRSSARCPLFSDGSFVYVPFPHSEGVNGAFPYSTEAWPFTNGLTWYQTHADPDWDHLTYGDFGFNPRAAALDGAGVGDTLLFWALLWDNPGDNWTTFTNAQSWHLIGSLRVEEILREGDSPSDASASNCLRAEYNAHFSSSRLEEGHVVFIGDVRHSRLFEYAVPFVTKLTRSSLLYRSFRTAAGERLPLSGKHWSGYTRSCRVICELDDADGRRRATILRDAIAERNDFDLLAKL